MSRGALRLALAGSALLLSAATNGNGDSLNGTCPGCGPEFIFFDNTANLTATAKGNFVVDPAKKYAVAYYPPSRHPHTEYCISDFQFLASADVPTLVQLNFEIEMIAGGAFNPINSDPQNDFYGQNSNFTILVGTTATYFDIPLNYQLTVPTATRAAIFITSNATFNWRYVTECTDNGDGYPLNFLATADSFQQKLRTAPDNTWVIVGNNDEGCWPSVRVLGTDNCNGTAVSHSATPSVTATATVSASHTATPSHSASCTPNPTTGSLEECIFSNLEESPIPLPFVGGAILTCNQRVAITFTPPCDVFPCSFDLTYLSVILKALPPSFLGPCATATVKFKIELGEFHRNLPPFRQLEGGAPAAGRELHASPSPNYAPYVDIQSTITTAPITVSAKHPSLFTLDLTGLHYSTWAPAVDRLDGDLKLIITPDIQYDCHGDHWCQQHLQQVPQQILWLLSQSPENSVPGPCPVNGPDCIHSNATSFLMLPACSNGHIPFIANASVPYTGAGRRQLWADDCIHSDAWAGTGFFPSMELGASVPWQFLRPTDCACRTQPDRRRLAAKKVKADTSRALALAPAAPSRLLAAGSAASTSAFFGRCAGAPSNAAVVPIVVADTTMAGAYTAGGSIPVQLGSEYFLQYPSPCSTAGCSHALDSLTLPLVVPSSFGGKDVAGLRVSARVYVPSASVTGYNVMTAHETTVSLTEVSVAVSPYMVGSTGTPFVTVNVQSTAMAYQDNGANAFVLGLTFALVASDGSVMTSTGEASLTGDPVLSWEYSVPVLVSGSESHPVLFTSLPSGNDVGMSAAFLPGVRLTAHVDESGVGSAASRVWNVACASFGGAATARRLSAAEANANRRGLSARGRSLAAAAPLDCPQTRLVDQAPFPLADNVAGGRFITTSVINLGAGSQAAQPVDALLVFPASCSRCTMQLAEAILPLAQGLGCGANANIQVSLGIWTGGAVQVNGVYDGSSFAALRNGFTPVTTAVTLTGDFAMTSLQMSGNGGGFTLSLPTDALTYGSLALRITSDTCFVLGSGSVPPEGTTFGSYSAGADVASHPVSVSDVRLLVRSGGAWQSTAEVPGLYVPSAVVSPWEPQCGGQVTGNAVSATRTPAAAAASQAAAAASASPAGQTGGQTGGSNTNSLGNTNGASSSSSGLMASVGAGGIAGIVIGAVAAALLVAAAAVLVATRMGHNGSAAAPARPAAAAAPQRSPSAGSAAAPVAPAAGGAGASTGVQSVLSPNARQRRPNDASA